MILSRVERPDNSSAFTEFFLASVSSGKFY